MCSSKAASVPHLCALLLLVVPSIARSLGNVTTLYVSVNGHDNGNCTSVSSPCATLTYAVEVVALFITPLDEPVPVSLAVGNFTASSCGTVSSRPLNISGGGQHDTLIDCEGADHLLLTSSSLWMSSLSILNGNSTRNGGGLAISTSGSQSPLTVSLTDVTVSECASNSSGGGIAIEAASTGPVTVTLSNIHVFDSANWNGNGGGVYLNGTGTGAWNVTIVGGMFSRNSAQYPPHYQYSCGNGTDSCLYLGNLQPAAIAFKFARVPFGAGGGLYVEVEAQRSTLSLINCTVSSNSATSTVGGMYVRVVVTSR